MSGDFDPDERANALYNNFQHDNFLQQSKLQGDRAWEDLAHSLQSDSMRLARKVGRLTEELAQRTASEQALINELNVQAAQYSLAIEAIRSLALRGVALRRTIRHLCERWGIDQPPSDEAIGEMLSQHTKRIAEDPEMIRWVEKAHIVDRGLNLPRQR